MTAERLWGYTYAFDHAVTLWITIGCASLLLIAAAAILVLSATGKIAPPLRRELWLRTASWAVIIPLLIVPVLAGAAWTIAAVTVLALLCYNEYARVTGLFRERIVSLFVVVGILLEAFAALDHWYGFFVAITPLAVALIAICSIPADRPGGYIQRVGLAVFAFLLFGTALGHLSYMANDMLFPEGTRSRDGAIAVFKPGLGCLVAGTSIPVVPCHIDGAFAAFPPDAKFPRAGRLAVRIGAPLRFADTTNDRAGWHAIAARTETAVRRLASP